ncbi:tetratricopeptide repeat protein [Marvinbryantia formatexigens]|nr:hypothetical protein [Marvinbryantia formatexigens]UWO24117.1 hypothetical protein NQ534_17045 [Marvinbryantia formatexigens DSM 14469]SDG69299.1 hypothetical protein SAMN05660368_03070 [Marvinbryantia formatexigens]
MDNEKKNSFYGITDIGQAEELLNLFRRDHPNDIVGAENMLQELLEVLLAPETKLTGTATDFHNFSVSITRITNDNRNALAIVKEGLKIHACDTDLLADALRYGYNCGEKEECETLYKRLQSIDKSSWTWRAFSFSIDYLIGIYSSDRVHSFSVEDILKLAQEYKENQPDEEDAWLSEQEIYAKTNQPEKGIKVLEEAMEKFSSCPRCWLRYADIMMDKGEYEKAEPVIKKMRRDPKTSEAINSSYMFYLDGLCKMRRLINSDEYDEGEVDPKEVLRVYKAFQLSLASPGLRENTKRNIEEQINRLSTETDIEYPQEWRV